MAGIAFINNHLKIYRLANGETELLFHLKFNTGNEDVYFPGFGSSISFPGSGHTHENNRSTLKLFREMYYSDDRISFMWSDEKKAFIVDDEESGDWEILFNGERKL